MTSGTALAALPHYTDIVSLNTDDPFFVDIVAPIESETMDAAVAAAGAAAIQAISQAIQDLIGRAPAVLDTLQELADAIGDDPNFATTLAQAMALKAPLLSPALTGTPTAPTAAANTISTQIATTSFVATAVASAVAALVNSSPAALDTLKELADAIGDDPNFAATMATMLGLRLRVDAPQAFSPVQIAQALGNLGVSDFVRTLLDDADQTTARATLGAAATIRKVSADGLATGGGDLTTDRTISVPKASAAEAQAAVDDTVALTPASGLALAKAQAVAILKAARAVLPTSSDGLASGEPYLNGTFIDFVP